MRHFVKTLFLTTQGSNVRLDHDAIRVERPDEAFVRIPLRQVEAVVVHGHINVTTGLLHRLARDGIDLTMLSRAGRFIGRFAGPMNGNVLLRQQQFDALNDRAATMTIAKAVVGAKLLNSRTLLLDATKDRPHQANELRTGAQTLHALADESRQAPSLDHLRGLEGNGAKTYFGRLAAVINEPSFRFTGRTRRPPTDPTNALLSYLYALLRMRCVGGLEAVGLDPQAGFLHALRPGRPALALDMMEELRSPFADRLALTLINRRQVTVTDLVERPGGSWELTERGRDTVLRAWDSFLDGDVPHRVYGTKLARKHVPHAQALLLARHLRRDLDHYLPFRTVSR